MREPHAHARLLAAYPYPAFELPLDAAPALAPRAPNGALRALLLGPAYAPDDDDEKPLDFAGALGSAQARALSDWTLIPGAPEATMEVELALAWTDARARLELVRTRVDGCIVVTSVPRAPLPAPPPLPLRAPPPPPAATTTGAPNGDHAPLPAASLALAPSPHAARAAHSTLLAASKHESKLDDRAPEPAPLPTPTTTADAPRPMPASSLLSLPAPAIAPSPHAEPDALLAAVKHETKLDDRAPEPAPLPTPTSIKSEPMLDDTSPTPTSPPPPLMLPPIPHPAPLAPPAATTPSCRELFEAHDWAATPLGPRAGWPRELHACVNYALANPFPTCVWWGPALVLIYNDGYAEVTGAKHPFNFGKAGEVAWGEIWEEIGPVSRRVVGGETVWRTEDLLFFNRLTERGLPEETYHNWNYVPVRDADGVINGFLNSAFNMTGKVIADRRLALLRELSMRAGLARTQAEFARGIVDVLEKSPLEAPFAAVWRVVAHDSSPAPAHVHLELSGAVGAPGDGSHPAFPATLNIALHPTDDDTSETSRSRAGSSSLPDAPAHDERTPGAFRDAANPTAAASISGSSGSARDSESARFPVVATFWPFARACANPGAALHVEHLPAWVTARVEPRAWGDTPREAVVIPLRASGTDDAEPAQGAGGVGALLVLALNSRRPYDAAYAAFVDLLRLSLGALLDAVAGREADGARARQLAQLDEAKTAFFSNASHEFRTPLTLIQGPLEDCLAILPRDSMREQNGNPSTGTGMGEDGARESGARALRERAVRERVSMALRNVARLKRLVDSLMDFSRLAANRLVGRFRPVALGPHTADLASLFRSVVERSGITYEVHCDEIGTAVVYVDPDFWEKIVFNLIGNAFKYTMAGKIKVWMEIRDGCVHFNVRDTGVGIPPGDIDRVFDRFYRVNTVGRSHEGTGIGLALTKELVILHGGRLTLSSLTADDSPNDHGSTFTAALPLGSAHLPAEHVDATPMTPGVDEGAHRMYGRGIVDEAGRWASSAPTLSAPGSSDAGETSGSDGSRLDPSTLFFVKTDRVLLVDDNADMRRYIAALLRPYCTVLEATNGQDALDVIDALRAEEEALAATAGGPAKSSQDSLKQRRMPDLIVSDIMMPILDGFGLVTRLRQRPDTRLLPIILVTAKESEEARVEGLLGGADDYLCKPFTARELIARVHLQMQLGKRRAELEALFSSRTREMQVLSDLSPVGIVRAGVDGKVTYANARWCEITGADGSAWPEKIGEGAERARAAWRAAFDERRSASAEFGFDNGRYAKGQFEPLISEQGTFAGVIGTLTDLSETRKHEAEKLAHAEERAATARQQAEDADMRRRGQELLIDVTSHELRQPVSAILNCSSLVRGNLATLYAELARDGVYTPNAAALQRMRDDLEALDAIYQCGLAQERIANDVLSLSRIQLEVLSIESVDFALVSELRRIVAIFSNEVKMKRIRLDVRLDPSVAALGVRNVRTDRARFGQIVTNLLSNAIKFTDTSTEARDIVATLSASRRAPPADAPCVPPEGPEAPLDASELPAEIYLYCAVKDSGPGLRPDDLALLFRRFQQGSNSHNVFGGSGLGLFVSRKLCELMHGHIDVASVYGQGATFRFYIRAQAVAGEPISSLSSPPVVRAPVPTQNSKLHVLIAEDNLINQTVLNRQLTAQGFATTLANNGQQALDHVRARAARGERFDAVLMDCEMPVMDGLDAVREIRRLETVGVLSNPPTLVFALTGNARAGQVQNALDAGMDDVVIKPYKLEQLVEKISGTVARRREAQRSAPGASAVATFPAPAPDKQD